MKMQGITNTLLLASFILLALVSVKIIENRDKIIERLEAKVIDYDRLLMVDQQQDSIIEAMPEYVPKDWCIDSNGVYKLKNVYND